MDQDPTTVIVTEDFCNACGTPRVNVHHQSFPEMWASGESVDEAVGKLANRLVANLDAVSDPMHRAPVQRAIADIQEFIHRDAIPQAKLSPVIDVLAARPVPLEAAPSTLVKTETLELRRLVLPKGRQIPTHHASGEITVHCLEGRIAFTSSGTTRELGAGQLIALAAGEPHSLVGLEDSSVLVTKVLLVRSSAN
jgi:quercetin dioxygenase-like cupin family protein